MTEEVMKRAARGAVLSLFLLGVTWAEEPVHFASAKLKAAVEQELWMTDPTPSDMLGLVYLYIGDEQISDLTGLEYAANLQTLRLPADWLSDLSPLSGLVSLQMLVINNNSLGKLSALSGLSNLRYLDAHDSLITDTSALAGLASLETVILRGNRISDISVFSNLTNLQELNLYGNRITDLSPLLELTSLQHVDLRSNPLSEEAYNSQIPEIISQNPGVSIEHDRLAFRLVLSSTAGGSVIQPGEGEFIIDDGNPVYIEAKADPCFVFVGFSGSYTSTTNPISLLLGQDHQILATFRSIRDVLCVDDDARGDPGPNDPKISDPDENGAPEHPFDRIQEAIDIAADGATIVVHAGTYREIVTLTGRRIELTGFDPEDPNVAAWPVIDGGGVGPAVNLTADEEPNCVLTGLVITGGKGQSVGAIRCVGSRPTIANCLIVGNRATDWNGAAILCTDSNVALVNCTIVDNHAGQFGAGLSLVNSTVTVVNSILWGNWPKEIMTEEEDSLSIRFSAVAGGWPGLSNRKDDPLFAGSGSWVDRNQPEMIVGPNNPTAMWVMADYHLQSQAGRWDPRAGKWLQDTASSSCIDGGDPATSLGQEPSPNGGIINMGAYGGTIEASKSSSNPLSP